MDIKVGDKVKVIGLIPFNIADKIKRGKVYEVVEVEPYNTYGVKISVEGKVYGLTLCDVELCD